MTVAGIEPNRCTIVNGIAVVHFHHKDYLTKSGGLFACKAGLFNDHQALLYLSLQHRTPIAFLNLKDEFLAFSLAVGSNGDESLYWVMVAASKKVWPENLIEPFNVAHLLVVPQCLTNVSWKAVGEGSAVCCSKYTTFCCCSKT